MKPRYAAVSASLKFLLMTGLLTTGNAWAADLCVRPQDLSALRTSALRQQIDGRVVHLPRSRIIQQIRRLVWRRIAELRCDTDEFFQRRNLATAQADYDTFKTDIANAQALRSART